MAIEFWLSFNNGAERLRLPVNPSSIVVSTDFGFNDIDVARLGEYTIIGEKGLSEVSLSSFFPRDYNPSYCEYSSIPDPWQAIQTLERWRDSRRPMRLTITGTPINLAVTLRNFSYDAEKAGEVGDIYFSMSLKEYRFVTFKKVDEPKKVGVASIASASNRPNPTSTPTTYTVKSGDTLSKIALRELKNQSRWREIYDLNKSVIGKNPNLIKPGQTLRLPL